MRNTHVALFIGLTLATGAVRADTIPVAILGSPAIPSWNSDVQAKLAATGLFSLVDVYDISSVTPTLTQLETYKSVLVYSDSPDYADPAALGDNLADYVDEGGGVVVAVFSNASLAFGGRFTTDNYWAIIPDDQTQGVELTLGSVFEPLSPLVDGVNSFDGGLSSYESTGQVHPGATVVAAWSDGSPLIVRRTIGGTPRVDLNFFPPSSDSRNDLWLSSTDGARLMGNALVYVDPENAEPDPVTVAEPSTDALLLSGLVGLLYLRRRRAAHRMS